MTWRSPAAAALALLALMVATAPAGAQRGAEVLVPEVPGFDEAPLEGSTGELTPELFVADQDLPDEQVAEIRRAFADGEIAGESRRLVRADGAAAVLGSYVFSDEEAADDFEDGLRERIGSSAAVPVSGLPAGAIGFDAVLDGGQQLRYAMYRTEGPLVTVAVVAPDVVEPFETVLAAQLRHAPAVAATVDDSRAPDADGDGGSSIARTIGWLSAPVLLVLLVVGGIAVNKRRQPSVGRE